MICFISMSDSKIKIVREKRRKMFGCSKREIVSEELKREGEKRKKKKKKLGKKKNQVKSKETTKKEREREKKKDGVSCNKTWTTNLVGEYC